MIKLWKLLTRHFNEDFRWPYYISVAFFIGIHLAINYRFNFENGIIDSYNGKPVRMLWYFLLYAWSYYGTLALTSLAQQQNLFRDKQFIKFSLLGIGVLAINMGFPYLSQIVRYLLPDYRMFTWAYYTGTNSISFFLSALPLLLISRSFETKPREMLGTVTPFDIKPYLLLLAIIIPFIAVAALEKGLGSYYPTYKTNSVAEMMNWPAWVPAAIYETVYAMDFFNVEFLFRGFFVIGMSRFIGKDAVMPMVVTYCFLHFGKPAGEAISSVVGGYVLGVIALHTRSIWGGVLLHIGVAWTMELAAYLAKLQPN